MKNLRLIKALIVSLLVPLLSYAQENKVIKSLDDIPRFSYQVEGKASSVYQDKQKFDKLSNQIKQDYTHLLAEYSISDNTLMKGILNILKQIDFYENNLDEARNKAESIRDLEEKPAARYMSGIVNFAYLNAAANYRPESGEFRNQFKSELTQLVSSLPWEIVQDAVEETKGNLEIISENLFLGIIQENMDPIAEQTGELSGDFATALISYQYNAQFVLPYKQEIIEVLGAYIDANYVEKDNIWNERELDISAMQGLHEVIVAIWDSGLDTDIFKSQLYTNPNEKPDNLDNDGNGFVDDIHGIAYDKDGNKDIHLLYPMNEEQVKRLPEMTELMKGITDLTSNISSEEASKLKRQLSNIQPEEVKPFLEELSLFGNYVHGTHVAGIAAAGNPGARLMASRITFDHKMIPELPTIEKAHIEAKMVRQTIDYYKANQVRIVNMSFGGNPKDIETALEMNGAGDSPEERKELAREIFDISKEAFYDAIRGAGDILFVAAAGNSDEDAEFYETIPSSFDLPNIITVGAVDQAGEETGFTSFGENVDVHANGFEVESFLPGGIRMKLSGTSMASPNVANLAAKLLAIDPGLSVAEIIQLILDGSDKSADGRINLINPQKSVGLLVSRK